MLEQLINNINNIHDELLSVFEQYQNENIPLLKVPLINEIIDKCYDIDQEILKLPLTNESYGIALMVSNTMKDIDEYLSMDMQDLPKECIDEIMAKYYNKVGYQEIHVNNVVWADFQNKRK